MIPNPIRRVLSTLSIHDVQYLLMGGQACVLYGAAEFSRDCDIAILCDALNLDRLQSALTELDAVPIAVPPFETAYLERGHAIHFRCRHSQAKDIRIDVMAKMRGVAPIETLWARRTTLADEDGFEIQLMSLGDLVSAKKTQRDKDWPMIRRLVEAHYAFHRRNPSDEHVRFWLREARTPDLLMDVAAKYPQVAAEILAERELVTEAIEADRSRLETALAAEEMRERKDDQCYWALLKNELEQIRRDLRKG